MGVCCAGELAGNVPWEVKHSSKMMTMMMMMVRMAMIARLTLLSGRRRGAAGAGVDVELLRKGGKN